eukprot:COSAG01_NODE_860_length_13064_cov_23.466949_8_plen_91_part_00
MGESCKSAHSMWRNDYFASKTQLLPQVCLTRGKSAHERGRSSSGRVAHPTGLGGVSRGCTRSSAPHAVVAIATAAQYGVGGKDRGLYQPV